VERWLTARGLGGNRPYVILHPGSGAAIKHWGVAHWARALERVTAGRTLEIILAGMPAEHPLLAAVAAVLAGTHPSHVYISEQGIGTYAALIAGARLMLGVDSGPLHVAVALGTPSVRLYGPTDPAHFGPWGPRERHAALASGLGCAPCGRLDYARAELPWHPCMAMLSPEAVAQAALRVLSAAPSAAQNESNAAQISLA
jgi:ADP-heptose:LPS heptosyltransferase